MRLKSSVNRSKGFVLLTSAHNIGKVGSSLLCLRTVRELRPYNMGKMSLLGRASFNAAAIMMIWISFKNTSGNINVLPKRYKMNLSVEPLPAIEEEEEAKTFTGIPVSEDFRETVLWKKN